MKKLLVGAAAAGALAITTGTALALSTQDGAGQPTSVASPMTSVSSSTATATSGPARLSAEDASRIVRTRMGGEVHEVEREDEHGRLEWKVEITASDGKTYDVRIDAETGAITRTDLDDDQHDDQHKGRDDHDDD